MKDNGAVTNVPKPVGSDPQTESNPQGGDMVRLDEALAEVLREMRDRDGRAA